MTKTNKDGLIFFPLRETFKYDVICFLQYLLCENLLGHYTGFLFAEIDMYMCESDVDFCVPSCYSLNLTPIHLFSEIRKLNLGHLGGIWYTSKISDITWSHCASPAVDTKFMLIAPSGGINVMPKCNKLLVEFYNVHLLVCVKHLSNPKGQSIKSLLNLYIDT